MAARQTPQPRTFFLNEQHELTHEEKPGGGGIPKLAPINWAAKGRTISHSLQKVRTRIDRSNDPLKKHRYFLLAEPVREVRKESKVRKIAPQGVYAEKPNYAGAEYSRVFRRLGMDLLQVNDDGSATVHALPERVNQMIQTSSSLDELGRMEQARWVAIEAFGIIPSRIRVDEGWILEVPQDHPVDIVIELQPLLSRVEIDEVLGALAKYLTEGRGEKLTGTGTDFSGRQWYRGLAARGSLRSIARNLFSVQSIHSPLRSLAAARRGRVASDISSSQNQRISSMPDRTVHNLPTVAVLDTGIPSDHLRLTQYRRGQYLDRFSAGRSLGDHGSLVASRVVFGDSNSYEGTSRLQGGCRYYDVNVAVSTSEIEDKSVVPSMVAVIGTAPDVRVFNLSFDNRIPLNVLDEVERREKLALVQDLDNFVFANDVLVVVASGNTPPGVTPAEPYPDHFDDPQWGLGHWARSFNALTCGSTVERLARDGLVTEIGWPSAFSRVGPGLCESPKPDFAAHGGNCTDSYDYAPGLGVWCCTAAGQWEDRSGTSFAVPLLAREAAFALQELQKVCQPGARPFGVTAKAFLALTATRRALDNRVKALADRAMGRGYANTSRLANPLARTAVFVWQGVIDGPKDLVRVQLPIPRKWLDRSSNPRLRLVVTWDTPVNAAAHDIWGSRRVTAHLRPGPDTRAMYRRPRGSGHRSYPISDKFFDLTRLPSGVTIQGDTWLVELTYEQIADDYPGIDFSPQQRVAFAAELWDASENPVSPQGSVQALPISQTMTRLSVPPAVVRAPVVLRVRW